MTVALASDHRGFKLKSILADYLKTKGYKIIDFGTYSKDSCDYPDYIYPAARAVRDQEAHRAIVICYTGIGSSIAANKVKGIRAALVFNLKSAKLTRQHNDSNVLVLAACLFNPEVAKKITLAWLRTEFEGGRHLKRLQKINAIEKGEE